MKDIDRLVIVALAIIAIGVRAQAPLPSTASSMGLQIAQMWDVADGKLVDMSSDTLPGLPTQEQILEMRAKGVQPTREGGFGYLRGADGAMIENAQAGTVERFNHVHMYHEHPNCAMDCGREIERDRIDAATDRATER